MSIFGKIVSAIFGGSAQAAPVTEDVKRDVAGSAPAPSTATPSATAGAPTAVAAAANKVSMSNVDVAASLDKIADAQDEDLDWRKSIVDLMKILKLDSSLKSRKELATELKYSGDMGDSATMNMWLHKQVMTKLAENGGVVPKDLQH